LAEADISDRSEDDRRTGFLVKDDNWIGFLVAAWISFLVYERFIGLPEWVYNLWENLG